MMIRIAAIAFLFLASTAQAEEAPPTAERAEEPRVVEDAATEEPRVAEEAATKEPRVAEEVPPPDAVPATVPATVEEESELVAEDFISIQGNLALPDEVYFAIIHLNGRAGVNPTTAALVGGQIHRFLKKAGYVLAKVRVDINHRIVITIDEGQVARVVFRGKGSLKSLQGKAMLDIPHNIFNKPWLERQLKALQESLNLIETSFELVPVTKGESAIPFEEIETLTLIKSVIDFEEKGDYELHIFLNRAQNNQYYRLKLGMNQEDGLIIKTGYGSEDRLFKDDKLNLYTNVGAATFTPLDGGDDYRTMALLQGGVQWYSPCLWSTFRPLLWVSFDRQARQRFDLEIERYRWLRFRASLNLDIRATKTLQIIVGGGVQKRTLSEVIHSDFSTGTLSYEDWGAVFSGSLNWTFAKDLVRLDRDHSLYLEGRLTPKAVMNTSWRIRWDWQKWFLYGWDGLMLGAKGTVYGGDTVFAEDEPVGGKYLRGVFGRTFYVRKVSAGTIEYRFALNRDIVSLGIFMDIAAFEPTQGQVGREILKRFNTPVVFGAATGLGMHFLISGMFQLSVNYALGVTYSGSGKEEDHQQSQGMAIKLTKAF